MSVDKHSKTDINDYNIDTNENEEAIKIIKEKIKKIDIDGLVMADKELEEFLVEFKWNPYPLVRYTERPDVAAHHLLSGYIVLMVDTSPNVMIIPTTFFDHLEHAEEFRQTPADRKSV